MRTDTYIDGPRTTDRQIQSGANQCTFSHTAEVSDARTIRHKGTLCASYNVWPEALGNRAIAALYQILLGTVPLFEQIVHSTTTKSDNFTMHLHLIMLHHYTPIQAGCWDH
jgi:hypothetical protein